MERVTFLHQDVPDESFIIGGFNVVGDFSATGGSDLGNFRCFSAYMLPVLVAKFSYVIIVTVHLSPSANPTSTSVTIHSSIARHQT